MSVKWQCEIDPYCRQVLAKHWPHVTRYGDIKAIDWATVEPVDLICGGFPCQPFSVAGKRRGTADDRYLWPEVMRCLDALRPAWFIGENVPGIINLALDQVCADLENLGYTVWLACLPACSQDAPHIRQRVWILAYATGSIQLRERAKQSWEKARPANHRRWPAEPNVGRVADGVPCRVDRIRALGNAIVPQIAEAIGRMILAVA